MGHGSLTQPREIGHGETGNDLRAVAQLAGQLAYTPEQLVAALQEVSEGYAADRGAALLQATFG